MSDSLNGQTAPRVSIIVPAYNAAATIAGAIDSALAQQFGGFEVIVVNDGSTDATAHMLDGYGDRIRIIQQPNCGAVAARNAASRAAGGEYLAFLDADDLWLPEKLKLTVEALDRSPRAVAAFSDHIVESSGKREIVQRTNSSPSLAELLSGGDAIVIYPTTAVVRKSVFDACGGFEERFGRRPGFHDTYLWLRLREHGEFVHVPVPLAIYRETEYAKHADKYGASRVLFRLVRQRYGKAARPLMQAASGWLASSLATKALGQLDRRENIGAALTLTRLTTIRPAFLAQIAGRLVLPQNRRRMRTLFHLERSTTHP
jgi:glycosyltransferase involved in cell wall biosynthesis